MKVYRSHDGLFLGVCKGMEESLGIPARYSRLLFIILAIIFRAWVILALYLLAAILMPIRSGEDWKIQDNFENLSRDARRWSRREYDDIREMLRKAGNSSSNYDPEEFYEETIEPEETPQAKTKTTRTAANSSSGKAKKPAAKSRKDSPEKS